MSDNEKRMLGVGTVEVREVNGKPEIRMFVPYNSWSEVLGYFRERIERGFFSDVIKADVRALWNHDDSIVLGRTKNGTLRFEDGEDGLSVLAVPPDTQAARDAIEQIKGGYVSGTSFSFRAKEDRWDYDKEPMERTLIRGEVLEFSPVTFPAYPESSAAATRAAFDAAVERRNQQQAEPDQNSNAPAQADGDAGAELELLRERLNLEEAD